MTKILYKFLNDKDGQIISAHDNSPWTIGEWREEAEAVACSRGFHASALSIDALKYVSGTVFAEVEVDGISDIEDDKECWSKMRIVRAWKWTKTESVKLAIHSARMCLKNFEDKYPTDMRPREAIDAAEKYLNDPSEENREAARSAAWAARSAARSAAWAAESAWAAAWAAESAWAARSAAWAAAWAAESAAKKEIDAFVVNTIIKDAQPWK
jgi:hypothetical protein